MARLGVSTTPQAATLLEAMCSWGSRFTLAGWKDSPVYILWNNYLEPGDSGEDIGCRYVTEKLLS